MQEPYLKELCLKVLRVCMKLCVTMLCVKELCVCMCVCIAMFCVKSCA